MEKKNKVWNVIENIVYYAILIPLVIITLSVVYQSIVYKDKIPHIFGYKLFMILNDEMDESIKFGDLVITKNIDAEKLKANDVIGFRNLADTVSIYKIKEISNEKSQEKNFIMYTPQNATNDIKNVNSSKVEGIVTKQIPKLGLIIYNIQKPIVLCIILATILFVGGIAYFIAARLDKRDEEKQQKEN